MMFENVYFWNKRLIFSGISFILTVLFSSFFLIVSWYFPWLFPPRTWITTLSLLVGMFFFMLLMIQYTAISQARYYSACAGTQIKNKKEMEFIISRIRASGVINYLKERTFQKVKRKLVNLKYFDIPSVMLKQLSKSNCYIELQMKKPQNGYKRILHQLSVFSRRKFKPSFIKDLTDEFDSSSLVSFDYKGEKFDGQMYTRGDWADVSVLKLANMPLRANKSDKLFYFQRLGEGISVYFITKKQYSILSWFIPLTLI